MDFYSSRSYFLFPFPITFLGKNNLLCPDSMFLLKFSYFYCFSGSSFCSNAPVICYWISGQSCSEQMALPEEHSHFSQRESMLIVLLFLLISYHTEQQFTCRKVNSHSFSNNHIQNKNERHTQRKIHPQRTSSPSGTLGIIWSQNVAQQNMLLEPVSCFKG